MFLRKFDNPSEGEGASLPPDVLLRATGLRKDYRLYDRPWRRIGSLLPSWMGVDNGRNFTALEPVSFDLRRGEALGIIGRNGSGKSTLLQLVAGVTQPSSGRVQRAGRVTALLELGCGFNPEFTGRENILMWGALMGFSKSEAASRVKDIADFSAIGSFLDRPVKIYSSGMFLRLAFSTMTSLDADVLLIDEALAVGDVFFRQKCYGRLQALRDRGAAILLVSHAMSEVEQYCNRSILLHQGRPVFEGSSTEAVKRYYLIESADLPPHSSASSPSHRSPLEEKSVDDKFFWPASEAFFETSTASVVSDGGASLVGVGLCDAEGHPCRSFQQGETASFFFEFELKEDIEIVSGGIEIVNERGIIVHGKTSLENGTTVPDHVFCGSRVQMRQDIRLDVAVGEYTFSVGLGALKQMDYAHVGDIVPPELYALLRRLCVVPHVGHFAVGYRSGGAPTRLVHHGMANLPGGIVARVLAPVHTETGKSFQAPLR